MKTLKKIWHRLVDLVVIELVALIFTVVITYFLLFINGIGCAFHNEWTQDVWLISEPVLLGIFRATFYLFGAFGFIVWGCMVSETVDDKQ